MCFLNHISQVKATIEIERFKFQLIKYHSSNIVIPNHELKQSIDKLERANLIYQQNLFEKSFESVKFEF